MAKPKPKPGRKTGYRHLEETREKIQASLLINRLTKHSMADKEIMTSSQVNAAKVLLNKVLPDLKAVEMDLTSKGEAVTGINLVLVPPEDDG